MPAVLLRSHLASHREKSVSARRGDFSTEGERRQLRSIAGLARFLLRLNPGQPAGPRE